MTPTAVLQASSSLLTQVASPAARSLALAGVAALGLAVFRVKTTSVRLFTWAAVLYAALAMPLLGWMLPPLSIPMPELLQPAFLQSASLGDGKAQPAFSEPRISQPLTAAPVPSSTGQNFIASDKSTRETPSVEIVRPASSPSRYLSGGSPLWSSIRWNFVAAGIYLAVAFLLLVRFLVGIAFSHRLMQASHIIDLPRVTETLAARASSSGLTFIPRVAESEFISVPVTTGALRSTILLPAGWCDWDDAKLDAVIAHELSHVARRDALTQRLSLLHRAIFWFSPLAWWLNRHLAGLAEQASDEAALSCGADRKDYARTLLEFFEALQSSPGRVWWQGVAMAKAGEAEQRVERILDWKGAVAMGIKKSGLKKSIAVMVVALAVPAVYLAASVHPANYNVSPQHVPFAQNQTPPPAPSAARAPQAQPNGTPEPAPAPAADLTPPPEPGAQAEPAPAPAAIDGTIRGTISGAPVPPPAPAAAVAPRGAHAYAVVGPVAPIAPVPPPAPRGVLIGQSATARSSHGRGFSYSYDYDDRQRFVIVSGKTDVLTMSGSTEDAEHVEKLRKTISGDFIWFQRDEKSYIVRDQATIDRARKLWAPQEELGRKQEELGKQQEALGKQQEELGARMEQVKVNVPDMSAELDKLKAELKQLTSSATMEQIGHVQSEIGELQSKIGELQSRAGEKQGKLGEEMGALGEKQGKLGEQQGELGRQQGELAKQASRQMKQLLDEAITKGTAQPEQ
jgi:beta-lactamase regulating signal transducer with metallopeptidase domain